MIEFSFRLINIWIDKSNFHSKFSKHWSITKNKTLELECYYYARELFGLECSTCYRGHDHAGLKFSVIICGYNLSISLADNRHWDYDTNTWMKQEN